MGQCAMVLLGIVSVFASIVELTSLFAGCHGGGDVLVQASIVADTTFKRLEHLGCSPLQTSVQLDSGGA